MSQWIEITRESLDYDDNDNSVFFWGYQDYNGAVYYQIDANELRQFLKELPEKE